MGGSMREMWDEIPLFVAQIRKADPRDFLVSHIHDVRDTPTHDKSLHQSLYVTTNKLHCGN